MPKRTPSIRRDEFIQAGIALFTEQRYEDVSVRDILDTVGVRTASPSVFYYYFEDKQALYRSCVESVAASYVDALDQAFEDDASLDCQIHAAYSVIADSMSHTHGALGAGQASQPFLLEAREHVTQQCATLVEKLLLRENPNMPHAEASVTALFLAGGLGQVMWSWQASQSDDDSVDNLAGAMQSLKSLTDTLVSHLH